MKITTFAAIYIGSYEVSMKVFEIRPGRKIRLMCAAVWSWGWTLTVRA